MIYVLAVLIIPTILFGALAGKLQTATLWVGKMIAPKGFDKEYPNGFQDAITPRYLENVNTLLVISYVAILVLGTIEDWFLGAAAFTLTVILQLVVWALLPKEIDIYLKWIMRDVAHRIVFNKKSKNIVASNIALKMYKDLEELENSIKDKHLALPSIDTINSMKLGGNSQ